MYRFNGTDGRLDRMCEAMLMVMEAFEKEHGEADGVSFKVGILGHSGDQPDVEFIPLIPYHNNHTKSSLYDSYSSDDSSRVNFFLSV